ncbi:MAG: Subtilisin-like serine protease [Chlorobi bacterium]|nr:Subtilisin-like serine protease [Chlorobiota bacterium]
MPPDASLVAVRCLPRIDNGMGMSRKIPLKKILKPREFAMPTEMVRAPVDDASLPDAPPCPLCEEGEPVPDPSELVGIFDYETDQRDLLISFLRLTHPGLDPAQPLHRGCLERSERELQRAQLRMEDGQAHYIDLSLGLTPILTTPIRMNADLRFTGRGVTIAFVDSGFYPHPDLILPRNRIVAMYDAVRNREVRDISRAGLADPRIPAWHGTMAASSAAGNGYLSHGRYRGIASDARLVLIRAMTPNYRIRTPQVVRALQWIRENRRRYDIRIVNLSLGVDEIAGSMDHPVIALVEELSASGVVIVAASGNNPSLPIKPPGSAPSAITVGGYNDHNSTEWMLRELWHSSYGSLPGNGIKPELLAPAIWVAAPILPRTAVKLEAEALFSMAVADDRELRRLIPVLAPLTPVGDRLRTARARPVLARSIVLSRIAAEKLITPDYKHVDGTSFAAPIVSSIVAQMLEARPNLNPAEVKEILSTTAMLLTDVPSEVQGHGIVNPGGAIEMTLNSVRDPWEGEHRPGTG